MPLLFIASVIARWLAGVMAHIALLDAAETSDPNGVMVNIFHHLVGKYPILMMIFAFLSLVVLNMMITNRGISRATEVTARFYLDSVPGRQMSVDADLASGAINYEAANKRRVNINLKSSQYSILDGISKLMSGEGITSLLVLILSLLFILPQLKFDSSNIFEVKLILSVGIMWQILQFASAMCYSYLLMAISRETTDARPIVKRRNLTAIITIFVGLAFSFLGAGYYLYVFLGTVILFAIRRYVGIGRSLKSDHSTVGEEMVEKNHSLTLNPIVIEIDPVCAAKLNSENRDIVNQISYLREKVEQELGFQFPPITLVDNSLLQEGEYTIQIRGTKFAQGTQELSLLLAVPGNNAVMLRQGRPTQDPVFGIQSLWIKPMEMAAATKGGYIVTDSAGVILTHLAKVIKDRPHKALLLQETQRLLKNKSNFDHVAELETLLSEIPLITVHSIFTRLLEEGFSLANISQITGLLSEALRLSLRRADEITAYVRHNLTVHYLEKITERQGKIDAITIGLNTARDLEEIFLNAETENQYTIRREKIITIFESISQKYKSSILGKRTPILITKAALRSNLATALRAVHIPLFVASFDEIGVNISINIVATI